jgi:hypothetical protein
VTYCPWSGFLPWYLLAGGEMALILADADTVESAADSIREELREGHI